MTASIILLCLLWLIWCFLHSLLISHWWLDRLRRLTGRYFSLYRIGYVLFSTLSLIPLLVFQYSLPYRTLFSWQGPWKIIQLLLLGYACVLFFWGKTSYDMDHFLGISGWRSFRRGEKPRSLPFRENGILAYLRHPWYSAGIAIVWGMGSVTTVTLPVKLLLTGYFLAGTLLEEKKLIKEIGEPYRRYRDRVPMLFPWKKPRKAGQ